MVQSRWWLPRLVRSTDGTAGNAPEINWQEAVARLAQERTRAEACVRMLKKYGDAAGIDRGSLAYDGAKAEYDAVIAGLNVALARKQQPASLADLRGRLQRGFEKREAFCQSVQQLIPQTSGEKSWIAEIVKGAVGPVIQAIQAVYFRAKDDNLLMRKTIQTQLEATAWPAFASVERAP